MESQIAQYLATQGPLGVFALVMFFLHNRLWETLVNREREYYDQARGDRERLLTILTEHTEEYVGLKESLYAIDRYIRNNGRSSGAGSRTP